jgi:3-oxoacyl-[acyl-carrier protein] reductase
MPGGNREMIKGVVPAPYEGTLAKMPVGRFGEF